MNPSTILGMILGAVIVALGVILSTKNPLDLVDLPSLLLVIGGTVAATLISYPLREVTRVFRIFMIVLRNDNLYAREDMVEMVNFSRLYFNGDLVVLENARARLKNPFLRMGVQLLIDGAPIDDIVELMQWRISRLKAREAAEAQIFRSMAMYAPAFGMLGTLLGLVNMLRGLQGDFNSIGLNLSLAMITTLYGILLANLVFKPIAIKFERRTEKRVMQMNMVLEGITLMAQKRSPSFIKIYLESLSEQPADELRSPASQVVAKPVRKTKG